MIMTIQLLILVLTLHVFLFNRCFESLEAPIIFQFNLKISAMHLVRNLLKGLVCYFKKFRYVLELRVLSNVKV